ncbi:MAG: hypothetical protein K9W44_07035 [Candidatus Lokiarchaeota archaeon]|nr:hypothetical protein [Candidatus Harpocratesius repetitus]
MDLTETFISIRESKGDSVAKQYLNDKKCSQLDLQIESLSMTLQMEFNRIQGSSLHQLQTNSVGNQIRDIIEDGINDIINVVNKNPRVFKAYLNYLYDDIQTHFSEDINQVFYEVQQLHLTYNFNQIVWKIKDFDYQTIIRILKCMLIANVLRRYNRRKFIPAGCYT